MRTGKPSVNQHQPQVTVPVQYNNQLYDRIRCLGRGSFGTAVVYRRRADCSLVVLKEIELHNFLSERHKCSVINEARIMSKLSHNNIIKYYNAYTTDTKLIIEMEYASLGTLAAYLAHQMQPLGEQEVLVIFRQIVCGVSYLHSKKIIHLDLKMTNIFVTSEGLVKIGDFGIAQYISDSRLQVSSGISNRRKQTIWGSTHLGTLAYSSPERCLGECTNYKSDIWSLGCIFYELISSKPLFSSNNLSDLLISITRIQFQPIAANISASMKHIFELMIARDPQRRPSASNLLNTIDKLLSQIEVHKYELQVKRPSHRFDLSSGVALFAAQNQENLDQISYLHSLVYQIRLDTQHVQVERLNLPLSKRIKEICKGKSHFLVLTYDNIVYGWGSGAHGELGACGLNTGGNSSRDRSTCSSIDSRLANHHLLNTQPYGSLQALSAASSLASSTQTIVPNHQHNKRLSVSTACQQMTKDFIMRELNLSKPITRPIVINELNNKRIIQVAAGRNFSLFLSKTGIVMTCGDGSSGCLGRGDFRSNYTPKMVESLLNKDVIYVASGPQHAVAVCGNGQAFAWGKNKNGRLGIGSSGFTVRRSTKLASNSNLSSTHILPALIRQPKTQPKYVLSPHPVNLSSQVHIKSVFCGDKCTVFIDSNNRCWACGENRCNRLGLDAKRKWKSKTIIVERNFMPQQIKSLKRYEIVSCSIGRNHSSFVTNDGKLIVLGRDIDYSNKFRGGVASINKGISHDSRLFHPEANNNYSTNHIESHRNTQELGQNQRASVSSLPYAPRAGRLNVFSRLVRLGERQRESYLKRSRLMKKMPLESVIGVASTSKFTLALTNNNRIYFWGTRSYRHNEKEPIEKVLEPQLVHNSHEDCFIKIGSTNNSLMKNIQALGSDQPIIHAQDPKLMAKTLSDLWILDYKLDNECSSSDLSSACSASSSLSSYSYCSLCSQCNSLQNNSCTSSRASLQSTSSTTYIRDGMRHDAILEPQPIISLYVPSMFNHSSCSLQMVDLFCHLEDRFYLVLDTTIKLKQCQSRPSSTQPQQTVQHAMNATRIQPNINYNQDYISYDGDLFGVDIELDGELANNLDELSRIETNEKKASNDNYHHHSHSDVGGDLRDGLSLEEPRSFSTFASSTNNHIVMGLSPCCTDEAPMMPLVFDDAEGSKVIMDEYDEKTAQNSGSKSEVSNTNVETSSMPSWVKNEFIQCQLNNNNNNSHQIRLEIDGEDLSIDQHYGMESMCKEKPAIFMGSNSEDIGEANNDATINKHAYFIATDTASNTSQQTIEEKMFKCDTNHSITKIHNTVSRSQPDICDTSSNHGLALGDLAQRRASILTERSEGNTSNLLQCNVYQNRMAIYRSLTPEFNSTSQLHYNSESQLNWMQPFNGAPVRNHETTKLASSAQDQLEINPTDVRRTSRKVDEQMVWSSWSSKLQVVGGKGLRKGGSYKMDGIKDKTDHSSSSYSLRRSLLKLFC